MSGIKGKNSQPEILIRKMLFAAGYRFRFHHRDLPGKPDIVMSGKKIAIFVHGRFWHAHKGCKYAKIPARRSDFWTSKLQANVERDQKAIEKLLTMGWRVLCIRECTTRDHQLVGLLKNEVVDWVNSDIQFSEISKPSS